MRHEEGGPPEEQEDVARFEAKLRERRWSPALGSKLGAVLRRRRKTIAAALALGGAALLGVFGMPKVIAWAKEADVACSNRDYSEAPGASAFCAGRARFWLMLPKLSPLHRQEAVATELAIRQDEAARALKRASLVTLDAAERERAAEALVAVSKERGFAPDRRTTDFAFSVIANLGAREIAARHGELARGMYDPRRALEAAIGAGDLARAEELSRREGDADDYEYHLTRGALLCLEGDAEAGRGALGQAMRAYQAMVSRKLVEAQMAAVACGADPSGLSQDVYRDALSAAKLLASPRSLPLELMLHPDAPFEERVRDENRASFVAAWVLERERSLESVLDRVASLRLRLGSALTPFSVSGPNVGDSPFSPHPLALDPARHEKAAERLDALAERVEKGELKARPLDLRGADAHLEFRPEARAVAERLRTDPAKVLRRAASGLFVEAAAARASAMDGQGALRSAKRALRDQRPDAVLGLQLAALLAAAGEEGAARDLLAPALEAPEADTRLFAEVNLALLEARAGRFEEAHAAAKRARALVEKAQAKIAPSPLAEDARASISDATGWLLLATSLKTGHLEDAPKVRTPEIYEREPSDWKTLIAASASERREARFRMRSLDLSTGAEMVLPAVLYVLREAADDGPNPEVWVDALLPLHSRRLNGLSGMRARAEAARWRGDASAAERWEGRARTIAERFSNPKRVLLARLSGLAD